MSIIVQKFGGTSVADATKLKAAARRAVSAQQEGHQVVVVVSARGHKTDELVSLAAEITDRPPPREMDMLLSTGEQESVALMAMAVHSLGVGSISFTGGQVGIVTDNSHTKARIQSISTDRMRKALDAGKIVIVAGFQGVDIEANITTLGRGGSDSTAAALAAVLRASRCEIYTDVEGVFTTDPRLVPAARKIERIAYDEMLELASLGAGVMHSRSIEFAKKYDVPLVVKPSQSDGSGTLIAAESDQVQRVVTGVALVKDTVRVTLADLPDRPGVMDQIFSRMAERKIPIDMVVQDASTDGRAEVSFTVPEEDLAEALTAAEQAVKELGAGKVRHGTNLSKVSAVGSGMRTHTGVAAQMFRTLADRGINIGLVTTSDIKISVLVDRDQAADAVRAVHEGFGLDQPETAPPGVGWRQQSTTGVHVVADAAAREREIVAQLAAMEDIVVSEVSLDASQSRVTLTRLPDVPGVASRIFEAVAEGGVMVDMIVQNVSHHGHTNISFTVPREDIDRCLLLVREVMEPWPEAELQHDRQIAKLSVAGIG
ncbi:MAG: aspartate kinase, partial [Planctomycetota bacterium]|nr:aspartate kinase [Planctomycetota bacterium]